MRPETDRIIRDPMFRNGVLRGIGPCILWRQLGGDDFAAKTTFNDAYHFFKANPDYTPPESAAPPIKSKRREYRTTLVEAQLNPPAEAPMPNAEVDALRRENAMLREQLTWAQRADSVSRTGGTLTLNRSDHHHGDRMHMLRCFEQMEDKSLILMRQYQPTRIVLLENGDAVAGRGIYKEQNMDSAVQATDDQNRIAAYKAYQFDERLKAEFPFADVQWKILCGNHDRNMGENIAPLLALTMRALGLSVAYCGDQYILNLAESGVYNLYAEHGYGYSDISPSAPKYISNVKDKLLSLSQSYYADKRIRRITHGHTHWASVGMERIQDIYFDTTGGCQRNSRVLLGKNNRPMGWIAYVSPEGYSDILQPILIQPDIDMVKEEIADPYLANRNQIDAAKTLEQYTRLAISLGLLDMTEPEGR